MLIKAPSMLPVSLTEAKAQLNITHNADDTHILALLRAATERAEQFMRRKIVHRTSKVFFNKFGDLLLPWGALTGVTSVRYRHEAGIWTDVVSTVYGVDTESEPGVIFLLDDQEWPTEELYPRNPIEVVFEHGWYHGPMWAAGTDAALGDLMVPTVANTTGYVYECTAAGETGDVEPTWETDTAAGVTSDGADVEWTIKGPSIPQSVRNAILIWMTDHYEQRETMIDLQLQKFKTAELLLAPYQVFL